MVYYQDSNFAWSAIISRAAELIITHFVLIGYNVRTNLFSSDLVYHEVFKRKVWTQKKVQKIQQQLLLKNLIPFLSQN